MARGTLSRAGKAPGARVSRRDRDNLYRLASALETIADFLEFLGLQSGHRKKTLRGSIRIYMKQTMKGETNMQLAPHKTFSNLHTHVNPVANLPADPNAPPDAPAVPDTGATLTVTSSDPTQVSVEADPAGGFFINTPASSGQATITFHAESPNATYEDVTWDYSYTPQPAGQISVLIGADTPDA